MAVNEAGKHGFSCSVDDAVGFGSFFGNSEDLGLIEEKVGLSGGASGSIDDDAVFDQSFHRAFSFGYGCYKNAYSDNNYKRFDIELGINGLIQWH